MHGFDLGDVHAHGVAIHDLHLVARREVVEQHVEQEAVELGFGQRIRALELDRVLRREHEERPLDLVVMAAHGDRELLHRLEQRGLRLRRRAVDLVREQHVREQRARHERPGAPARGDVLFDDVGARDVRRHQVGRELDSLEREPERIASVRTSSVLAVPGMPVMSSGRRRAG